MVFENIDFRSIVSDLESAGLYDILLPFFLVFTIIFGILEKINIFGTDSHKLNIIIAMVIGFLMVRNDTLVRLMNSFLPNVSMFVIGIIAFLIILGIFGVKADTWGGGLLFIGVIVGLIGVLWSLAGAAEEEGIDWLPEWMDLTSADVKILAGVGAVLIAIWFAVSKKKNRSMGSDFLRGINSMGNAFKPGGHP